THEGAHDRPGSALLRRRARRRRRSRRHSPLNRDTGRPMERIASELKYEGRIANVRIDRFRYADGTESEREIVTHPGAVGVIAYDDEHVWLVRQPREAVGEERLLEVPAGKLDVDG